MYDIWIREYATDKKIDWKTFNYFQFSANWSKCSAKDIAKLQSWAFIKFYFTKLRFLKLIFSLKRSQIIGFSRKVLKILLPTGLYNTFIDWIKGNKKIYHSMR